MRVLESGAAAPYIGGVAPANGVAYEPEELWAINDWRHIYDQDAGASVLAAGFDGVLVLGLTAPIERGPFAAPASLMPYNGVGHRGGKVGTWDLGGPGESG